MRTHQPTTCKPLTTVASDGTRRHDEKRATWKVIGGASVLSVLMRLRMLWSPVSVDEGGYLAIARAWAHGRVLYRDVFVDRPQGLLLLFRFWDWISGANTGSIRIMAMMFGILLVVSTAILVRQLFGHEAARCAAVICAVVSAAPVLEGYAANTELLSGSVAAAGLAFGVVALSRPHPLRWFFASGMLAGVALSLKQSGFDGLLTLMVWLFISFVMAPGRRRPVAKAIGAVALGAASVVGALMLDGASIGWSLWWTAVAGYRLRTQSMFAAAQWVNLVDTAPVAIVVLGSSAVLALSTIQRTLTGFVRRVRFAWAPEPATVLIWLSWASLSFFIGGGFWRHYWILLTAPISALAGVALAGLRTAGLRRFAVAATLAPCLIITTWVYAGDQGHLNIRAAQDYHAVLDAQVASWFTAHREPGDSLYVLCASAAAYADSHQDPQYPYLWFFEVRHAAQAQDRLVSYLGDPRRRPDVIAEYERASACDTSGRVQKILRAEYRRVGRVGTVLMFMRKSESTEDLPPA